MNIKLKKNHQNTTTEHGGVMGPFCLAFACVSVGYSQVCSFLPQSEFMHGLLIRDFK